jgi:chemotaxis protein MotA
MRFKKFPRVKISNFAGVITGVLFLVLVIAFAANDPLAFVNIPGLLVVLGGTITAMLVSYSYQDVLDSVKQARVLKEPMALDLTIEANQILHFSQLWFRHQYAQIDSDLEKLDEGFLQKGLQMVRDRQSSEDVVSLLNWNISQVRAKESKVINIFRSMARFAPAFGLVGSVIGLVNLLQSVGHEGLQAVSSGMGLALVTTFYGLLLANLLFKPVATKLEQRCNLKVIQLTMIAEGISLIQQKRTPAAIRDVLMGFIQGFEPVRESSQKAPNVVKDLTVKKPRKKSMLMKFGV